MDDKHGIEDFNKVAVDQFEDFTEIACGTCGRAMPSYIRPKRPGKDVQWRCQCGALVVVLPS